MESWEKVNAVQRMQDYIASHLAEPITLHMLAQASGYSPWYCTRLFKELCGKSPFEYIRLLRLSKAALRLRDSDDRVLDVALDFVFDSHEGFTRAFSKQFGLSPKEYQNRTPPLRLFMPYAIRDYYLMLQKGEDHMAEKNEKNTPAVFVQVVERPARKLIIKRGIKATEYFGYCEEVGCDIWGELSSIKEALYEPIGMWLPDRFRTAGTSFYAQGVEVPVDYTGAVPEGCEIIDLPACKVMVFQGPPYEDEQYNEAIEQVWEVMKRYNPELYGFAWADDDGPRFQLAPMGYRGYIEARPVRQINSK